MAFVGDLTGDRFGQLIVLGFYGFVFIDNKTKCLWVCECDCGTVKIIKQDYLQIGDTKSCGCLKRRGPPKKQFCIRGHDTFQCGRSKNGNCKICVSIDSKEKRLRGVVLAPNITSKICKNGHDVVISGIDRDGRCSECRRVWSKEKAWKNWGIKYYDGTAFVYTHYEEAFKLQNERCANKSCNKHQLELTNSLSVDHDHKTGLFRGLLCGNCNTLLGLMEDNFKTVEGLREYLKGQR
jgi:hypothetical protein